MREADTADDERLSPASELPTDDDICKLSVLSVLPRLPDVPWASCTVFMLTFIICKGCEWAACL